MTDVGRTAILRSARRAFARQPYAAVTLRGIAKDAGVSASLIVKHFGGKESLFDQVADFSDAAELLLAAPDAELGRHAVVTLIQWRRDNGSDLLLRVVFAIGISDERKLLRERFHDQVVRAFAGRLSGDDIALRADLIVAHLLGLGAALAVDKTGPTASADPAQVADLYAPALQSLIS
ncbi:TetR/AcrR family transcriptional regulator [Kribbella sp. VKM Ac-2568]|uniref:TetR/AcrR family transcriptional regulator n=1 Tax=Kribbella sp. VKM Ac-2568 TaxID=2512219 RepID=UPI0010445970|nr:TetR/AcrR family transcriptional regulator [Kribbella sp. VKM Ac-2568]TCM38585.1 TetR family transcriptional regulator [Kribbella sp. VKM Ac-2568]